MKTKIEIEIKNISVTSGTYGGYYCFDWFAKVNGKNKKGHYDSSYSSQSSHAIRGKLKRGYAVEIAVTQIFGF